MQQEVKERVDKMAALAVELGQLSAETLVGAHDADTEQIRKVLVDKSKVAFRTFQAEAARSIGAFKVTAKKAVKVLSKAKSQQGDSASLIPWATVVSQSSALRGRSGQGPNHFTQT